MITKPEFLNKFGNHLNRRDHIDCLLPHLVITNACIQHVGPTMQAPEVTPMTFIVLPDSTGEIETGMYGIALLPNKYSGINSGNLTFGFNLFTEPETKEWAEHLIKHGLIDYITPKTDSPEEYTQNYELVGSRSKSKRAYISQKGGSIYYSPLQEVLSSIARNHISFSDERLTDLNRYK